MTVWAGCGAREDNPNGEAPPPPGMNMLPATPGGMGPAPMGAAGSTAGPAPMTGGPSTMQPPTGGTNPSTAGSGGMDMPTGTDPGTPMMMEASSAPIPENSQAYPLM